MNQLTIGRLLVLCFVGLMGCEDEPVPGKPGPVTEQTAHASLKDADGVDVGYVMFTEMADGNVRVSIVVLDGRTPGEHGVHIHEVGRCDPPDFMTAEDHWNPTGEMHGGPYSPEHHSGDFGNVTVGPEGAGEVDIVTDRLSLEEGAPNSILGLSVIYHENRDDLVTQMPPGNAGARLACGIITR